MLPDSVWWCMQLARSRARSAVARPHLLLPRSIVTLAGNVAAVCFRPRLPLDSEFAARGRAPEDDGAALRPRDRVTEFDD